MLSPQTIASMSFKAAEKAAKEGKVPFVTWAGDIAAFRRGRKFPFPFLGAYVPEGWELEQEYFVDITGWDLNDAGGPALSINAFIRILEEFIGSGWAITEGGEFQAMIGRYSRQR